MSFCCLNFHLSFRLFVSQKHGGSDHEVSNNSLYQLKNYELIHQERNTGLKGGGVCIYVHNSVNYKVMHDRSFCNNDVESLCIEILNKSTKNLILCVTYRPPAGQANTF